MASVISDKTSYGYNQPGNAELYRAPGRDDPPPYPTEQISGIVPPPVVSQPVSHSNVNIGPSKPVAAPQNIRDWSTGLYGCCADTTTCCFACCCFPCFMCNLSERLGEHFCGPCCCGSMFVALLRNKVRTMYGIRGTACNDACTALCCGACAMLQLKRELDIMDSLSNN